MKSHPCAPPFASPRLQPALHGRVLGQTAPRARPALRGTAWLACALALPLGLGLWAVEALVRLVLAAAGAG